MKKTALIIVLILSMTMSSSICVFPQKMESGTEIRNWSFSANTGGSLGGPFKDIENAMSISNFDKTSRNWLSPLFGLEPYTNHPHTNKTPTWMFSVKRYLNNKFSIAVIVGNSYHNETHGYHGIGGYLFIDNSVISIAPIFSINSYDILRFGVGPSLNFTKAWNSPSEEPVEEYSKTKVGIMMDLGLRIPEKSRFFFDLGMQFRFVGKAKIGPFSAENSAGVSILPQIELNYNHWNLGAGVGIRF